MRYRELVCSYGEDQAFTMLRIMEQMARIQSAMQDLYEDRDEEKELRLKDAASLIARARFAH